ncbi:MAG: DUF5309 family protein [Desulfobacteraceae bacterium]|nr:DUF5309 family protein [Desulfobacteraceae bacterium]
MPTILGLRDTADFQASERPGDWRDGILRLYPRSEQKAPLNALIAGMKREKTVDPRFDWHEKGAPVRSSMIDNATGYTVGDTALTVDDSAPFRKWDLVLNARTEEVMRVISDPATGTAIDVSRGWGSTAAAIVDNDELVVIGTAIAEGAKSRSGLYTDPTDVFNYCQIFRHPLKLTNTAKSTKLRTGKAKAEMKLEALDQHTIDMERGFIFGVRNKDSSGDEPVRSTGGIYSFITTNKTTVAGAGALTYDAFNTFLMNLFSKGSPERICFCGNRFLKVINDMVEARGEQNMKAGDEVYGIKITKYITAFGTVYFKNHPLFNEVTAHRGLGLFGDLRNIRYRPLDGRDTQYLPNRQDSDEDCTKDEFLTEAGLEVRHEATHGILSNVLSYAP